MGDLENQHENLKKLSETWFASYTNAEKAQVEINGKLKQALSRPPTAEHEMQTDPIELLTQEKLAEITEFACKEKGNTF
jgi:hypothetical protein